MFSTSSNSHNVFYCTITEIKYLVVGYFSTGCNSPRVIFGIPSTVGASIILCSISKQGPPGTVKPHFNSKNFPP